MQYSPIAPHPLRQFYHRHDKVVTLLDKIRNTRHLNRLKCPPHWGPIWAATSQSSHQPRSRGRKLIGECMRRRVLDPRVAVLRRFAAAGLALLIGSAGAFAQSGSPSPQDQSGKPPAANAADANKDNQRKTDEFVEAAAGHQRPGRKPRMRLARPPGGSPDVAGRPGYRVPPPRSLRPVRLPRRPCPGGLPLPDPLRRTDRPQGARKPWTAASTSAGSTRAPSPRLPRRPTRRRRLRPPATRRRHRPPRPRRLPAQRPPRRQNRRPAFRIRSAERS